MKIVQLLHTLASGGAEIFAVNLSIALQKEGAEVTVVTVIDSEDPLRPRMEQTLTGIGVGYERLRKIAYRKSLGPVIRYVRLLRRLRPDIVHSHSDVPTWINGCFTSLGHRPAKRVCTLHSTNERFIRFFPANLRKPWNDFHRIVCASQPVMDLTEPAPNKSVIPVARDLSPFLSAASYHNRAKFRRQLGIEEDELVFLNVASFRADHVKNQQGLIRGMALLPKEMPVKLVLVGDGPIRGYLERESSELGVAGKIHFAGIQEEVVRYYALADVFVMPSLFEGLPLAGIEALVSGLPCLFSRVEPLLYLGKGVSGVDYFDDVGPDAIGKGLLQARKMWWPTRWRRPELERNKLAEEYGIHTCLRRYLGPEGYDVGSVNNPSYK